MIRFNGKKTEKGKTVNLFCLIFILFLGCGLQGAASCQEMEVDLESAIKLYLTGQRIIYSQEDTLEEGRNKLLAAKEVFLDLAESVDRSYWLARVEYQLGELEEACGDARSAATAFTWCGQWAEKAIKSDKKHSDAHRVLADSYMRLMSYNGTFYLVTKGPQALSLLKKAVSLDQNNYKAYISMGMYYLGAPAIGGGSNKKALEVLNIALDTADELDMFLCNAWLGHAYKRLNDKDRAIEHYSKALAIYPDSQWARDFIGATTDI